MNDKTPPGNGGVSVHGGEPDTPSTAHRIRNVLSLDDARRRRELSETSRRREDDEDGPEPPRAA